MKILFITANRLGDAVLSTGVLAALVERYPDARFTIACGPYAAGLFRAVPGLERVMILEKQNWNRHWLDLWAACIGTRWDLIVDLRNSLAARFLRAGRRVHRSGSNGEHKVIENARVLNLAPPPAPRIWLDMEAEKNAARILPAARPLLALAPTANWIPKQWPVERFAALAQKLTAENGPLAGASVIVVADEPERDSILPLLAVLGSRGIPVIGEDLLTVAACLKSCALFVGNDSGLMHLAAAMNIPVLGLFGPGEPEIYAPWGGMVVRTPESREELWRRLPYPGAHYPNLMEGLSVDKAYNAACDLLKKASSPARGEEDLDWL